MFADLLTNWLWVFDKWGECRYETTLHNRWRISLIFCDIRELVDRALNIFDFVTEQGAYGEALIK